MKKFELGLAISRITEASLRVTAGPFLKLISGLRNLREAIQFRDDLNHFLQERVILLYKKIFVRITEKTLGLLLNINQIQ